MKPADEALNDVREMILARLGLLRVFLTRAEISDDGRFEDEVFQAMENERLFLALLLELME